MPPRPAFSTLEACATERPRGPSVVAGFVHTEPVAKRVTCPTFVGREAELSQLEHAAEAARDETQLVLIGGDAGVGKTRLIDELGRRSGGRRRRGGGGRLRRPRRRRDRLRTTGGGAAPVADDVRTDEVVDALLGEVAPELRPLLNGGRDRGEVRPGAVLEQTLALLEALGERSPGLVVAFEDLHWADASTRDLVAYLARHLRGRRSRWWSATGPTTSTVATRCVRCSAS